MTGIPMGFIMLSSCIFMIDFQPSSCPVGMALSLKLAPVQSSVRRRKDAGLRDLITLLRAPATDASSILAHKFS